jgi:hypothetical protein
VRALSNFIVKPATESGDKLTRFGPFSSQCRAGNVKILRGLWNEDLFRVLEGFPDLAHDDEVDACSGAYEMLNPAMKGWGVFEYYRQEAEKKAEREAPVEPPKPNYAPASWSGSSNTALSAEQPTRSDGPGFYILSQSPKVVAGTGSNVRQPAIVRAIPRLLRSVRERA